MSTGSVNLGPRIFQSADGRARITITPVQHRNQGVIIDLEVLLHPDPKAGARPNKWTVSWINDLQVIEENFEPFMVKYCPEPEKVLTLFREIRTEHLSFP